MATKIGNISKFTKELKIFANWTVDATKYTYHKKLVVAPKSLKALDFKTMFQKICHANFYLLELIKKIQFAMTDTMGSFSV